ncbi:MFS transporter [Pantoea sp. B65]|uniref:MFS transporter n=1 Tax=Pantoea sp. B65 TaxID=2813359 RepID=UPI0039B59DEA
MEKTLSNAKHTPVSRADQPVAEVQHHVEAPELRRVLLATGVGHFVEWFDFGLYGTLAVIIGGQFFHAGDTQSSLLMAFAVFGAGFIMRPLGGLFFGSLGDRIGRKHVLATVILLTSASTFAIGLLPTWSQAGIFAPVLLVIARLVQGFAAGGESSGATTFLAEYAPEHRRGFFSCWVDNFGFMAFVAGGGIVLLLTALLGDNAMYDWGWRLPFLLAGPLGITGLYLRNRLEDTPVFKQMAKSGAVEKNPLRKALSTEWRALLFCVGFVTIKAVGHWVLQAFMPSYLIQNFSYSKLASYAITTSGLLAIALLVPVMGWLSDKYGRKPLMLAGCAGFMVFTYPALMWMSHGDVISALLAMLVLGTFIAAFDGACSAAMAELFPSNIRYGGMAIAYNFTVAIFGGITPYFSIWLIGITGDKFSPAYYVMAAALITFVTILKARETAYLPLRRH